MDESEKPKADTSSTKAKRHKRGTPYSCNLCDKKFKIKLEFNLHKRKVHNDASYRCEICSKGFTTHTDLKYHRAVHTGLHRYLCQYCGLRFDRPARWKQHVNNRHLSLGDLEYRCTKCKEAFLECAELLAHMKVHRKGIEYVCDICYRSFNSEDDLQDHCEIKHQQEREWECDACDNTFPNKSRLKWHKIEVHRDEFPCLSCGVNFSTTSRLDRHVLSKHTEYAYKLPIDCFLPQESSELVVLWTNDFDEDFKIARTKVNWDNFVVCTFDIVWEKKYLKLLSSCVEFESTIVTVEQPKKHAHFIRVFTFGSHSLPNSWKDRRFKSYRNFEKRISSYAKSEQKSISHIISSSKKNEFTTALSNSLKYTPVFTF